VQIKVQLPLPTRFYARPVANYAQEGKLRGRDVLLRANGLGGRPSPAEPKPAIGLGDWGRSCKLRHWALGSGLCDMDMWGVVANYAQKELWGHKVQLRAYGLGGRLSPAVPKPATLLGDWGRSCKTRPEGDFFIYPAECYGLQSSLGRFQLLFGSVLFHLFYEST